MFSVTGHAQGSGAAKSSTRSAPVITAITPGIVVASGGVDGDDLARARPGCGRARMCSGAGNDEVVDEARLAGEQRRVLLAEGALARGRRAGSVTAVMRDSRRRRLGRREHGLHDVVVAGAAAEVAFEAEADVALGRVRVLLEERDRRHDHARPCRSRTAGRAARGTPAAPDGTRRRWRGPRSCVTDGAVGLRGEHRARLHGLAVDEHGARAARRRVASDLGAGERRTPPGGTARATCAASTSWSCARGRSPSCRSACVPPRVRIASKPRADPVVRPDAASRNDRSAAHVRTGGRDRDAYQATLLALHRAIGSRPSPGARPRCCGSSRRARPSPRAATRSPPSRRSAPTARRRSPRRRRATRSGPAARSSSSRPSPRVLMTTVTVVVDTDT